jgi:hypothetical protein
MVVVVVRADEFGDLVVDAVAAAISSTARWMLWPIVGGASSSTTPSDVVRNAD